LGIHGFISPISATPCNPLKTNDIVVVLHLQSLLP
jgi:hypothetical protein